MRSPIGVKPESNAGSSDELAAFSNLTRGAGEIMVEERIGLAKPELLASLNENPQNNRTGTSVPRRLKLKFIHKIALPIVNTGTEASAKLELIAFQVNDDDDDGWTFEEFQERILRERTGRRILQGNTCLQLKEGVGFVHDIHFTHDSQHTKNGLYKLGAIAVDAALVKHVEGACTETFVVKDKRSIYYEKHMNPLLSDKVCRLQQIRYKGTRYKNLQDEKVETVRDLLILLYTDPNRLEKILDLKASSKIWGDIVKNAQASNGMFLYLDPRKTGVVLDARRQLKALILDPHRYIPVDRLSDQQKVEAQNLVKFASEHLQVLGYFEDETSLQKHIQSGAGFTSLPEGQPTTSSQVTEACLNNSNHTPIVPSESERGKEAVTFDDEMIYSTTYNQEHISFRPHTLTSPNGPNFWSAATSQAFEPLDTCGLVNTSGANSHYWEEQDDIMNYISAFLFESPNIECHSSVSVCTIAGTRWRKVSKLLRRNSVRERISLLTEIQPLKKQKCCC